MRHHASVIARHGRGVSLANLPFGICPDDPPDRRTSVLPLLLACAKQDLSDPPVPLGQFVLGLNVVVTDNMQKVPISREATGAEWEAALEQAMEDRFGRYEGDRIYNFALRSMPMRWPRRGFRLWRRPSQCSRSRRISGMTPARLN